MSKELLEKIDGLIHQATQEKSHFYVKSVLLECKEAIRGSEGVTLRDRLAMAYITGWIARGTAVGLHGDSAQRAYEMADAMLAEREKGKKLKVTAKIVGTPPPFKPLDAREEKK